MQQLSKASSIKDLALHQDNLFQKRDRILSMNEEDEWSNTQYSKASTSISLKSDTENKTETDSLCDEKRINAYCFAKPNSDQDSHKKPIHNFKII